VTGLCHAKSVRPRPGYGVPTTLASVAAVDAALAVATVALVASLRGDGRPTAPTADVVASLVAVAVGLAVASAVVVRVPANPVGWVLLAIPTVYALDGLLSFLPAQLAGSAPGTAGVLAALGQPVWLWLLALVALALLLVPDGRLPSRRWRRGLSLGAVLVAAAYVDLVLTPTGGGFDGAARGLPDPLGIAALDGPWGQALRSVLAVGSLLLVALAVVSVLPRYRRADPETRLQLKWVALTSVSVPLFIGALVLAHVSTGADSVLTGLVILVGFDAVMLAVPVGVALAVTRYRLYSVDEVVDTTVTWVVVSVLVVTIAAVVVVGVGVLVGRDAPVAVALATAAALVAVRPLRSRVQQRVNRRFHRRAYDAERSTAEYVSRLHAGRASLDDLEAALARAVRGPVTVLLPLEEGGWTRVDGRPVAAAPGRDVHHGDLVVARLVSDAPPDAVAAAGRSAVLALDNARLRAAALVQLAEVRASRQRIVEAQLAERRRLERNLHDGAQQRLVAAALNLALARDGDPEHVAIASALINDTVKEVRELGRGLHPAVLTEDGLVAAIESLADRTPVPVAVDVVVSEELPDDVAAAVYFAVGEGLTNALKHGDPHRITVEGGVEDHLLRVVVADDGVGGAVLAPGGGLAGVRDRLQALGGDLRVDARSGTRLEIEVPCAP
jgi:signal transduction histidine kinase